MTGASPRWSDDEIATLTRLILSGIPLGQISRTMGRTIPAIRLQCNRQRLVRRHPSRATPLRVEEGEWQPRPPVREYPADCCTWMEGHRPNWTRCENTVFRKSAWCEEHYRRVYSYRRDYDYARA